ncbi:MAG: hypothetical protein GWN58_64040, partial [Anaerolineae bacterium]|nr:hypothetical protein [Anaerolineae bacterium]
RDASFVAADGANSAIVINEIDYHQVANPDPQEFIELYNPSATAVDLQYLEVALVNGSDSPPTVYTTIPLSPQVSLCAGEYLVISSSNVAVDPAAKLILFGATKSNIQDGDDGFGDGVAIVNSVDATYLDALSYGGEVPGLVEGTATTAVDDANKGSLARCPNGLDTDNAIDDWIWVIDETPGTANACP